MPDRLPDPPETEAALVLRCADGDADAWRRFVLRFGPLVAALGRRMLMRRTGRAIEADVEEVVANVFLALVKGERRLLRRYRPEFRLSTYLGVICRTEVGKLLRRPRAAQTYSLDDEEDGGRHADPGSPTPLADLERRERDTAVQSLRTALDRMPPRDRLLLTLKFIEGLDYAQIAEVLRVQRDSVGQLLHRAKARLALEVPELAQWVEGSGSGDRGGA